MGDRFARLLTVDVDRSMFSIAISPADEDSDEGALAPESTSPPTLAIGRETPILHTQEAGLCFVAAREYGDTAVDVRITAAAPELAPAAQDVVELSIVATEEVALTSWDGSGEPHPLPLEPDVAYRVRYSVFDADAGGLDTLGDSYRIEFWPENAAPPRVVTSGTEWMQRWTGRHAEEVARPRIVEGWVASTFDSTPRYMRFVDGVATGSLSSLPSSGESTMVDEETARLRRENLLRRLARGIGEPPSDPPPAKPDPLDRP